MASVKQTITAGLKAGDLDAVLQLPPKKLIRPLFSSLCSSDKIIKWHAVSALGMAVAKIADKDLEDARQIMRRLMWNLTEESGTIGWGMPEAMAQIMICHTQLAEEFAHLLLSYIREDGNFFEYEPLQRGVLWGISQLAQARPYLFTDMEIYPHISIFFQSGDAAVRGLAAMAAGELNVKEVRREIEKLLTDESPVEIYFQKQQRFQIYTVSELAGIALKKIDENSITIE